MTVDGDDWFSYSFKIPKEKLGTVMEIKALINDRDWAVGSNLLLTVSAGSVYYFPWFFKTRGTYVVIPGFHSSVLENTRALVVYTPPSYYENPYKYYDVMVIPKGMIVYLTDTFCS
jgi:hypothetical protein